MTGGVYTTLGPGAGGVGGNGAGCGATSQADSTPSADAAQSERVNVLNCLTGYLGGLSSSRT